MSKEMKFPRIHIATSVTNRLLNLRDAIAPVAIPSAAPNVPNPTMEGAQLTGQLAQPTPPVAATGDVVAPVEEGLASSLVQ